MIPQRTPSEILRIFRVVLKEASKAFAKSQSEITLAQFHLIAAGRLGIHLINKVGGYRVVREYVAPGKCVKVSKADLQCLERIVKSAKAA